MCNFLNSRPLRKTEGKDSKSFRSLLPAMCFHSSFLSREAYFLCHPSIHNPEIHGFNKALVI